MGGCMGGWEAFMIPILIFFSYLEISWLGLREYTLDMVVRGVGCGVLREERLG